MDLYYTKQTRSLNKALKKLTFFNPEWPLPKLKRVFAHHADLVAAIWEERGQKGFEEEIFTPVPWESLVLQVPNLPIKKPTAYNDTVAAYMRHVANAIWREGGFHAE